jgi:hypothetical protein
MALFKNNLSSLLFLTGLASTAGITLMLDGINYTPQSASSFPVQSTQLALNLKRGLTAQDKKSATVAWRYFENNYRPETGLVDAVAGFPSGTLWDQGSYLLALIAAEDIGLIEPVNFIQRVDKFLNTMSRLELYNGQLPNKVYHTQTLRMVDYENILTPDGIGWSALDVSRLLSALRVLELHHPAYGPRLRQTLARWDLHAMAKDGRLYGAQHNVKGHYLTQEGRLGYEQYGARAAALWGLDVLDAASAKSILAWHDIAGTALPIDQRRAKQFGALTPILSEPFLLQALEMGLTSEGQILAERVYQAQENRYQRTGIPTMVSEGHVDQAPYFLYTSVFSNGQDWAVIAEDGSMHPDLRSISLKAAFGWEAIYATDYAKSIRDSMLDLASPEGWASGRYEKDGRDNWIHTANTNAVVLQALYYKKNGPMMQLAR